MERTLPALAWSPRQLAIVAALAALLPLNVMAIAHLANSWQVGVAPDYQQYAAALERMLAGEPIYRADSLYRYAPAFLVVAGPFLALGVWGWSLLHVAALALLRPWWLALLVGLSWPFWVDVVSGNSVTFALVTGALAMRGSRAGGLGFTFLAVAVPRPFMLPLLAWLVWKRPEWRAGMLAVGVGVLLVSLPALAEWIAYLRVYGLGDAADVPWNIHPFPGVAWLLVGVPLGIILTWRGWPGPAGVVLSPYLLAQYLLMAFLARQPTNPEAEVLAGGDGAAQPDDRERRLPALDAGG